MPTIAPNMGLYYDRPAIAVSRRALIDGQNFRVKDGTIQTNNLGWAPFNDIDLGRPVLLIDNFFPRDLDEGLIFGTDRDLYLFDRDTSNLRYLNARYSGGSASASGTTVTGTGTSWLANAGIGDQIHFGNASFDNPAGVWRTIASVTDDDTLTLTEDVGTVADGNYTIRKIFHLGSFDGWDTDTWVNEAFTGDDLWIATNGVDPVVSWNGSDATVTVHSEMGFVCATLANSNTNFMVYGDITQGENYPAGIINSELGSPFLAGDTGVSLSEQFVVHGGSDGIINIVPMGDIFIIYCNRHIVSAQFVGGDLVFIFRQLLGGIGPVSGSAIADFGDFHEFIAADSMYRFDGVSLEEVNPHVMRDVLRRADPQRRFRIYGHFDEEQGDLIWSIPLTTDPGVGQGDAPPVWAMVEEYLEDAGEGLPTPFAKREFPFTATGFYQQSTGLRWEDLTDEVWEDMNYSWDDQFFQAAYPLNLAGDHTGRVFVLNTTQTADGEPLMNFVRFGRFPLNSGRERSLFTRVYPGVRQFNNDVLVTVRLMDHAAGPATIAETVAFDQTLPPEGHFVSIYRRGRFAEVQFGSADGLPWILESWDFDIVKGGLR